MLICQNYCNTDGKFSPAVGMDNVSGCCVCVPGHFAYFILLNKEHLGLFYM